MCTFKTEVLKKLEREGENGDRRSGMGECEERAEAAASPPLLPRNLSSLEESSMSVWQCGETTSLLSSVWCVQSVSALILKYMHT